jgi:hypothetical protein
MSIELAQRIRVNDTEIAYREVGHGRPLVLLHSFLPGLQAAVARCEAVESYGESVRTYSAPAGRRLGHKER